MSHRIELESSFLSGGWVARCSCGWSGTEQDTMREASADSASHLRFVARGSHPSKDGPSGSAEPLQPEAAPNQFRCSSGCKASAPCHAACPDRSGDEL